MSIAYERRPAPHSMPLPPGLRRRTRVRRNGYPSVWLAVAPEGFQLATEVTCYSRCFKAAAHGSSSCAGKQGAAADYTMLMHFTMLMRGACKLYGVAGACASFEDPC